MTWPAARRPVTAAALSRVRVPGDVGKRVRDQDRARRAAQRAESGAARNRKSLTGKMPKIGSTRRQEDPVSGCNHFWVVTEISMKDAMMTEQCKTCKTRQAGLIADWPWRL